MAKDDLFAGWLVASDIDGTINNKIRRMPKKNKDAIENFVSKGGIFTLASGRNPQSMKTIFDKLPIKGTPAVVMNGAGIYDYESNEMLHFFPMSEEAMRMVINASKLFPLIDLLIITKDMIYVTGAGWFGKAFVRYGSLDHRCIRHIEDVPRENWGKVVFSGLPSHIRRLKKHFESLNDPDLSTVSSSVASFEILAKGINKGTALMKIADTMGIRKSHVGAIGDYFNDYDMLKSVGVPACCGQAPYAMKKIAEYVTCHCNRGAVADFLGYIRNKAEMNY